MAQVTRARTRKFNREHCSDFGPIDMNNHLSSLKESRVKTRFTYRKSAFSTRKRGLKNTCDAGVSKRWGCTLGLTLLFCLNSQGQYTADTDRRDIKRPNVIFILVDDQGYYDLGCYGATEVKTPRVDALAQKGVRFTDYYAAAPICSPSRAGLLTGCYPRRTGSEIWVHRPDAKEGIPPSRLTLAELFKDAGYATACIGKWHLGFQEQFLPKKQGI